MAENFFTEWSVVVVCGVLNVLPNMVPLLQNPQAQSIFSRSFMITHALSRQLPILAVLIKGLQAMTSSLRETFPPAIQSVFQNVADSEVIAGDVPTMYQLPHSEEIRKFLLDENADATSVGVDLSFVIAKWSAISVTNAST